MKYSVCVLYGDVVV